MGPGNWYTALAPNPRAACAPTGPVLPTMDGDRPLPLMVDLVGTPWEVNLAMDWSPKELDKGNRLEKLTLQYMQYLTQLAPASAVALMADRCGRAPPYVPGYSKDTWNCYGLSIRVQTWIDILSAHPHVADPATRRKIDQSIAAQLRFLACNLELDIGGNHLMKNIRALLRGGRYYEGAEADSWMALGLEELAAQLHEQVLPDGLHFELSPAYHLQVLEDLMDIRRAVASAAGGAEPTTAAIANRVLRELDNALRRMALAARRLTHPDGNPSLFADGGLHMASPASALLKMLAAWGVIEPNEVGRALGAWRLPNGGYVGLGTETGLLVVDCGAVGAQHLPAHGHGDALAIEWSVAGRRFIVDAGVFEYHAGPRRAFSRSTAAHNTLTLDDLDQSEFWSSFRVARRANVRVEAWEPRSDGFTLTASHDGYRSLRGRPVHRRTIDATACRLVVRDAVEGGAGQSVRARLLLAAGTSVGAVERTPAGQWKVWLELPASDHGDSIRAELCSSVPLSAVTVETFPDFGVSVASTQIVMDGGAAPSQIEWSVTVE